MSGEILDTGTASSSPSRARLGLVIVVTMTFAGIHFFYAAYMVPKFAHIFQDILGPTPLPWLTTLILKHTWGLTVFWLILAVVVACVLRARAYLWVAVALLVFDVGIMTVALTLPLTKVVKAIGESQSGAPAR